MRNTSPRVAWASRYRPSSSTTLSLARPRRRPRPRRVELRVLEVERVDRDVRRGCLGIQPGKLRHLTVDDQALGDEHHDLRRLARGQAVDERAQAADRVARALPGVLGDRASFGSHLTDAHHDLRLATAASTLTDAGVSAFAFDDVLHAECVFAFEGKRVGDPESLHAEARKRSPVDLLNAPFDERMVGGEGDLRSVRDRRERDAVGTVQLPDEPACGLDCRSSTAGRDARPVHDDHDEPAARRVGVRRVGRCRRRSEVAAAAVRQRGPPRTARTRSFAGDRRREARTRLPSDREWAGHCRQWR